MVQKTKLYLHLPGIKPNSFTAHISVKDGTMSFMMSVMTADVIQFSTKLKSDYISVSLKQILDLAMQCFTVRAVEQGHSS